VPIDDGHVQLANSSAREVLADRARGLARLGEEQDA
jgi:hypothetical protein